MSESQQSSPAIKFASVHISHNISTFRTETDEVYIVRSLGWYHKRNRINDETLIAQLNQARVNYYVNVGPIFNRREKVKCICRYRAIIDILQNPQPENNQICYEYYDDAYPKIGYMRTCCKGWCVYHNVIDKTQIRVLDLARLRYDCADILRAMIWFHAIGLFGDMRILSADVRKYMYGLCLRLAAARYIEL